MVPRMTPLDQAFLDKTKELCDQFVGACDDFVARVDSSWEATAPVLIGLRGRLSNLADLANNERTHTAVWGQMSDSVEAMRSITDALKAMYEYSDEEAAEDRDGGADEHN